ncbi:hypothetical protein [Flavobacterium lacisediminis]|uniref:Uncharacterized protein n=1 Tax=Flavobacterium lacisediminis TaxID=2989705 RepID=A0ABT3EFQ6_9FLAO|nr:hypothetical protein [Flavobacterium lacisediminis]MCW1147417.1 hypothetical protein [Flavobacterium lacisediminis]
MLKLVNIFLLLSCGIINAHKNKIFQKSYGNVDLISSTAFLTEEVNKNIITAKYVELLLKEMNYENKINLRLTQDKEFKCYAFFDNEESKSKVLNILIYEKETDINKTLSLVENIIINQISLDRSKNMFSIWYNSKSSEHVENILNNKIFRPKDVLELKILDSYDYFYEKGIYHILSYQNGKIIEVAKLDKILQLSTPTYNLLFVFTEINSLTVITANYKYNFEEKKYNNTSETLSFDFTPEWEYSFRPYSFRLLGQNFITIESIFGDKVSLYNISKKKFIQDLLVMIKE